MVAVLIDRQLVEEIRQVERATGRTDLLSGFVAKLEESVADFPARALPKPVTSSPHSASWTRAPSLLRGR